MSVHTKQNTEREREGERERGIATIRRRKDGEEGGVCYEWRERETERDRDCTG